MKIFFYQIIFGFLLLAGCEKTSITIEENTESVKKAVAILQPLNGSNISGIIYFNDNIGSIDVIASVNGLSLGNHGFHIHTYGDFSSSKGLSTGDIYDPLKIGRENSEATKRQLGNLGNIYAPENLIAKYNQTIFSMSINGINSILGRAIVIHEHEDDFSSEPCGNAGEIIAAGIIGISNTE